MKRLNVRIISAFLQYFEAIWNNISGDAGLPVISAKDNPNEQYEST